MFEIVCKARYNYLSSPFIFSEIDYFQGNNNHIFKVINCQAGFRVDDLSDRINYFIEQDL